MFVVAQFIGLPSPDKSGNYIFARWFNYWPSLYSRKTSTELCPPKPKEMDSAVLTFFWRATLGT